MAASGVTPPLDGSQQQFLGTIEAWRDLERGERLDLRLRRTIGQQIGLGQIAMCGGFVGWTERQRRLELAHRRGRLVALERQTPEAAVCERIEWIDRHDAVVRRQQRLRRRGFFGERRKTPGGLDGRVILRKDRPILGHRTRGVAELLGQPRHDRARAVVPCCRRDERRSLFKRLECRAIARGGQRLTVSQLRFVVARMRRRSQTERRHVERDWTRTPSTGGAGGSIDPGIARRAARRAQSAYRARLSNDACKSGSVTPTIFSIAALPSIPWPYDFTSAWSFASPCVRTM